MTIKKVVYFGNLGTIIIKQCSLRKTPSRVVSVFGSDGCDYTETYQYGHIYSECLVKFLRENYSNLIIEFDFDMKDFSMLENSKHSRSVDNFGVAISEEDCFFSLLSSMENPLIGFDGVFDAEEGESSYYVYYNTDGLVIFESSVISSVIVSTAIYAIDRNGNKLDNILNLESDTINSIMPTLLRECEPNLTIVRNNENLCKYLDITKHHFLEIDDGGFKFIDFANNKYLETLHLFSDCF